MVKYVMEKFEKIDILINAAGFGIIAPSIVDIDNEEWDLIVNVNLKGAFNTSKAIVPFMKKQYGGRIINISSMAGRTKSVIAGIHYTSAKAGLIGFTRHLSSELIRDNITVNAICPGVINTDLVQSQKTKRELKDISESIPIGRLGETRDLIKGIKYLADFDNSYITGTCLDINGGLYMN